MAEEVLTAEDRLFQGRAMIREAGLHLAVASEEPDPVAQRRRIIDAAELAKRAWSVLTQDGHLTR